MDFYTEPLSVSLKRSGKERRKRVKERRKERGRKAGRTEEGRYKRMRRGGD